MIGGFRSIFCVFVFQGALLETIIMIDGSVKCNSKGKGWLLNFRVQVFLKTTVMPFWTVTCTLDKLIFVMYFICCSQSALIYYSVAASSLHSYCRVLNRRRHPAIDRHLRWDL